jgi:hypothetical protein
VTKAFTGNLNAAVNEGHPAFPSKEKHYLRAQLARITHSTALVPRGMVPKGDAAEEAEAEEGAEAGPGPNAVIDVSVLTAEAEWLHARPPLLVQGRVERWPPKEEGEEAEEDVSAAKKEEARLAAIKLAENAGEVWEGIEDPFAGVDLKPTKPITEDRRLNGGVAPAFTMRRDPKVQGSPILIRSTYWPGAYTLAYGGKKAKIARFALFFSLFLHFLSPCDLHCLLYFCSIYVGFGQKYVGIPYTLPPPPAIPEEYPDMDEAVCCSPYLLLPLFTNSLPYCSISSVTLYLSLAG